MTPRPARPPKEGRKDGRTDGRGHAKHLGRLAFRPLIRTRDERRGVERRRTDGQRGRQGGINSRVVKIPDAAAANSAPFSLARNVE